MNVRRARGAFANSALLDDWREFSWGCPVPQICRCFPRCAPSLLLQANGVAEEGGLCGPGRWHDEVVFWRVPHSGVWIHCELLDEYLKGAWPFTVGAAWDTNFVYIFVFFVFVPYYFLYTFMVYMDTASSKYAKAPGSSGAEGGSFRVRCLSVPLAVQQRPLKDVFNNSAVSAGGSGGRSTSRTASWYAAGWSSSCPSVRSLWKTMTFLQGASRSRPSRSTPLSVSGSVSLFVRRSEHSAPFLAGARG